MDQDTVVIKTVECVPDSKKLKNNHLSQITFLRTHLQSWWISGCGGAVNGRGGPQAANPKGLKLINGSDPAVEFYTGNERTRL